MGPVAQSDGHDAPGLIDEFVPGAAAMIDDVVVGFEESWRRLFGQRPAEIKWIPAGLC